MKTVIVLAMHGAPPKDFPRQEMIELFSLHGRMEHAGPDDRAVLKQRHDEVEAKMRTWPRSSANDPFFAASLELAQQLSLVAGSPVVVGFNEFCAPRLDEALEEAVTLGADRVVITTPMMTPGGAHAQSDIPAFISEAQNRHPEIAFDYAWPFGASEVARFLAEQIHRLVG